LEPLFSCSIEDFSDSRAEVLKQYNDYHDIQKQYYEKLSNRIFD